MLFDQGTVGDTYVSISASDRVIIRCKRRVILAIALFLFISYS